MPSETLDLRTPRRRVPVNVITGALGAGKTTALTALFEARPPDERWAVLVNEAGRVGVDGALLAAASGDPAVIREVPGGCMCCVAGLPSRVALVDLLRRVRPDRLLVEPTGLGHPEAILEMIDSLEDAVERRATWTLVDPRRLAERRFREHPIFEDQAQLADVLVATHADVATDGDMARFASWAKRFFPAKSAILSTPPIPALSWLDAAPAARQPLHPGAHDDDRGHAHDDAHDPDHAHDDGHGHDHDREPVSAPELGRPTRLDADGRGHRTCGWVFHPDERFDEARLVAFFRSRDLPRRAKAVLPVADGAGTTHMAFDRSAGGLHVRPVAHRGEGRAELIAEADEKPVWEALERALLAARAETA